jgi:hypothetical protein
VKLVRALVPDAIACDEVASGVREELAREGAYAPGDDWPRVEIEVLRADEASEGIAAGAGRPIARAVDLAVVARAWIAAAPGGAPQSDTGDMRAEETIAVDLGARAPQAIVVDARAGGFARADALRAAARRLGRALALRLLGLPVSSEDPAEGR